MSLFPLLGMGQTLQPGDVVILSFQGYGTDVSTAGQDNFTFMPLVNLQAGTIIHFTDVGWVSGAFASAEDGSGTGDMITYTAPTTITAGTIIKQDYANVGGSAFTAYTGYLNNFIKSFNALDETSDRSGEQIFIFQGTKESPSFIWAIANKAWASTSTNNSHSELPNTLTAGVTAMVLPNLSGEDITADDAAYSGSTTAATKAEWQTKILNTSNWTLGAKTGTTYNYLNGSSITTPSGSYTVTIPAVPTVSSISPSSGTTAGGTSVVITGTNLTGATSVLFGSTAGTGVTVNSATSITVTSPVGTAGTIHITVTTPGGTSATSTSDQFTYAAPGTFTQATSTDWATASNWIGGVPTSATNVTIPSGKTVVISATTQASCNNLTVSGSLTIASTSSGTGTIITNGTVSGTGTTNVEQYLTSGRNWYISSPLSAATGNVVLGTSGNSLWQYNEVNSDWTTDATSTSTPLSVMKGFIAKTGADGVITFTGGTPNTGNQSITVNRTDNANPSRGFNLVGNPYPSYVDWSAATKTNLLTTMWYRTKEGSDYKFYTYNSEGTGIGVPASVTSQIPPMQAFWIRVDNIGTGTLAFTNAMRAHQSGTNPLRAPAAEKTTTQKILRLQVSNGTNRDEAVVYFNSNASDEYDAYDSPKMSNGNVAIPEIYTLVGTEKTVINGLSNVTPNKEIALGFTTGETNTFTIKATEIKNFDADTKIILKDKLLNTEQELTSTTNYSFSSDPVSTASRFSIIYKSASANTGINNTTDNTGVNIFRNIDNQITINCSGGYDGTITVCNALGQKLISMKNTGAITVIRKSFKSGVYVVTANISGKCTTKKVIIN